MPEIYSPIVRLRRLRRHPIIRELIRETELSVRDLVLPLFIRHGQNIKKPISSLPGHYQITLDHLPAELDSILALNIPAVILFGIPSQKDAYGSDSYHPHGIIQQAIAVIKAHAPQLLVMTDNCFCEYTDHGHCGVIHQHGTLTDVDNDATLGLLGQQAVSHAKAGADIIAPSGMMDGMIGQIRKDLDEAGFSHIPILSYAAKYASALYGAFREAAECAPQFGDRKTYQMDPGNAHEALREIALDIEEGADMLMVKPAGYYLDIIHKIKQHHPELPLAAYQVSGEYAMIKAAAAQGWLDEQQIALESLLAIKRAGANFIISYFAKEVAQWLKH